MKILHIASHSVNMGDGAIIAGIQHYLREAIYQVDITNMEITDYDQPDKQIDLESIEKAGFDLVLVGGGGTIDGHRIRRRTGTALRVDLDDLRKTNLKFAFVGLGHNLFNHQEQHHVDKLQELVSVCEEKGYPFSVRDDGSKERLSQVMDTSYIDVIPDPGFFVPIMDNAALPEVHPSRVHCVIQIAGDNALYRYGSEEQVNSFLSGMVRVIDSIIDVDMDVVLAVHTANDLGILNKIPLNSHAYRYSVRVTSLGMPINAPYFFRSYSMARFVVGTRGHSVICGAGLRVPTVAISTHNKVQGFMDAAGLSDVCIPYHDFSPQLLLDKIEYATNTPRLVSDQRMVEWAFGFETFMRKALNQ